MDELNEDVGGRRGEREGVDPDSLEYFHQEQVHDNMDEEACGHGRVLGCQRDAFTHERTCGYG